MEQKNCLLQSQNLVKNLESQQTQTDFSQSASTKQAEDRVEAKGWFVG